MPDGDKGPMIPVALPPNASTARDTFVGPFSFAKGPLVLISRELVSEIVAERSWAWTSLRQISWRVNELNDPAVINADAYPQDDAWLGMALSASVDGTRGGAVPTAAGSRNRPLVALHAGSVVYAEGYVDRAYPLQSTTLVWHNGHALNKHDKHADALTPNSSHLADRIRSVHSLMQRNTSRHCHTPNVTLNCNTPTFFRSCGGALWDRCLVVHNYEACPRMKLKEWG